MIMIIVMIAGKGNVVFIIIITLAPALCMYGHAFCTKVCVILLHVAVFNHNYQDLW